MSLPMPSSRKNGETSNYIVRVRLNGEDNRLAMRLNVVPGMACLCLHQDRGTDILGIYHQAHCRQPAKKCHREIGRQSCTVKWPVKTGQVFTQTRTVSMTVWQGYQIPISR